METRKIALACFISGLLGAVTAWYFSPHYWWLGLLSGFAGGYLSYEFRETFEAFIEAAEIAFSGAWIEVSEIAVMMKKWLCEPHPCFYLSTSIAFCLTPMFVRFLKIPWQNTHNASQLIVLSVVVYGVVAFWLFMVTGLVITVLAKLGGAKLERIEPPLTYREVYSGVGKGLWLVLRWMVVSVFWSPVVFARFACHFFRLIHSDKRLLCGVDGMLGGAASYWWLIAPRMTIAEVVLMVASGGLLGAFFGVLNWEIVSKRFLKVEKVLA